MTTESSIKTIIRVHNH